MMKHIVFSAVFSLMFLAQGTSAAMDGTIDPSDHHEPIEIFEKVEPDYFDDAASMMMPTGGAPSKLPASRNLRGEANFDSASPSEERELFVGNTVNNIPVTGFRIMVRSMSQCLQTLAGSGGTTSFATCNGSDEQQWMFERTVVTVRRQDGTVHDVDRYVFRNHKLNLCLAANDQNNQVTATTCDPSSAHQKWMAFSHNEDSQVGPFLYNQAKQTCLGKNTAGTGVEQQACITTSLSNTDAILRQIWLYSRPEAQGPLATFHGNKCLSYDLIYSDIRIDICRPKGYNFGNFESDANGQIKLKYDTSKCLRMSVGTLQTQKLTIGTCITSWYYWKGLPEHDSSYQQRPGLIYKIDHGWGLCLYHAGADSTPIQIRGCTYEEPERFEVMYYGMTY